jgi:hypothetical protein
MRICPAKTRRPEAPALSPLGVEEGAKALLVDTRIEHVPALESMPRDEHREEEQAAAAPVPLIGPRRLAA